ncbi:hypothetical protein Patl1_32183 [Pistacia atlantica]|uniref:Uncharacterized protein n=1 Tax=Pistacia atlantica TaxID=434234 RepID=A0ACC1AN35_9ROSI|nr:hypothetical protein Patl1_32183 [Pistacia atlantica]
MYLVADNVAINCFSSTTHLPPIASSSLLKDTLPMVSMVSWYGSFSIGLRANGTYEMTSVTKVFNGDSGTLQGCRGVTILNPVTAMEDALITQSALTYPSCRWMTIGGIVERKTIGRVVEGETTGGVTRRRTISRVVERRVEADKNAS